MKKLWMLTGLIVLVTLLGTCAETKLAESPEGVLSVQATWPTVRQGDQGQTVRTVQYLLTAQG